MRFKCNWARPTCDEQGITGEDRSIISVPEEVTYAVLRMTRRMQCGHRYVLSDLELLSMFRGLCDGFTILSADDRQTAKALELRMYIHT